MSTHTADAATLLESLQAAPAVVVGTSAGAGIAIDLAVRRGARSPDSMLRDVRALAAAIPTARPQRIEGSGHAAPFDATADFVQLIGGAVAASRSAGRP
jgi:pimeloyl-ACP methyl ester carboxylesterase